MRPRTKVMVVILMNTMVCCSIHFFIHNTVVDWIVGILGLIGTFVVIFKVPNSK